MHLSYKFSYQKGAQLAKKGKSLFNLLNEELIEN